jgi:hypothetical protein
VDGFAVVQNPEVAEPPWSEQMRRAAYVAEDLISCDKLYILIGTYVYLITISRQQFVKSLAGRHARVVLPLVIAAQAEGLLVEEDPMQVMCFLMASVPQPRFVASAWQGPSLFGKELSSALSCIARDRNRIVQRLDWAIRGLTLRVN